MKELTIEEKAQRYDEAIERAKEINREHSKKGFKISDDVLYIFPELRESKKSEDELHRKWILEYLYDGLRKSDEQFKGQFKCAIAWLEKQGEKKSIWHNEDEEPQKDSLILLIMQSGTPIVAKIIEPNHTFNHGERWAYIDDLLEKQSEQKPTEEYNITGIGSKNAQCKLGEMIKNLKPVNKVLEQKVI